MIVRGLAYGLLSTRRRARALLLPVLTTATGTFLTVLVFSLTGGAGQRFAGFGHPGQARRATVLVALVVLLVGVVEVAVCSTRTVTARTREIGVLGATGVRRAAVLAALLVEPVLAAGVGAGAGTMLAAGTDAALAWTRAGAAPAGGAAALGAAVAVVVSLASAALTSAPPCWRAASRPPIRSLSHGG